MISIEKAKKLLKAIKSQDFDADLALEDWQKEGFVEVEKSKVDELIKFYNSIKYPSGNVALLGKLIKEAIEEMKVKNLDKSDKK